jgi:hypothetical protein
VGRHGGEREVETRGEVERGEMKVTQFPLTRRMMRWRMMKNSKTSRTMTIQN